MCSSVWVTHLEQEEKAHADVRRVAVLECGIASATRLAPLPLASECNTLCNVAKDGRLNSDGLGANQCHVYEGRIASTFSASTIASSHFCMRVRTRARLANK